MKPIPVPQELTPKEFVSVSLRQCALMLDPEYGRLSVLSHDLGVHETTVRLWIRTGQVPHKYGIALLKRFGKKWVDFDRLTGG